MSGWNDFTSTCVRGGLHGKRKSPWFGEIHGIKYHDQGRRGRLSGGVFDVLPARRCGRGGSGPRHGPQLAGLHGRAGLYLIRYRHGGACPAGDTAERWCDAKLSDGRRRR
jgi:hypothetical protein